MARAGSLMRTLARLQGYMLLGGRCLRVKSVGVKIHCCKTWVSMVQSRVSPWSCTGSADVGSDNTVKAEHLHMEVENHPKKKSSAKTTAETSQFSGRLAHLHKLVAVTASFVPPFVHPCKLLGAGNISLCSWLAHQQLRVLKHMLLRRSTLGGERLPGVMFMGISKGVTSHEMLGHRDAATLYSSEGWSYKENASLFPNSNTMNLPTE